MTIGKELRRIRLLQRPKMSVEKFAGYVGLDAARLRKWEDNDINPRPEDTLKIENYFGVKIDELHTIEKFKFYSKNVPSSVNALDSLLEVNKIYADAHKNLSESHLKVVDTNSYLSRTVTGKTVQGIPEGLLPKFGQILEFLAEVGVGKLWPTAEHGADILHRRFFGSGPGGSEGDSPPGVHK